MAEKKEPFISQEDRPEVKIDPDRPVSELRVRDLEAILVSGALKKFKDLKFEKVEIKDLKFEKIEHKEWKIEKYEKLEKYEKHEKFELEPVPKPFEVGPGPGPLGDPAIRAGLAQLVETIGGLTKRVDELTNQVAELQKRSR